MTELVPQRLTGRADRRAGRDLARVEAESRLMQIRIGRTADIQALRVNSLAYVGRQALHAAAMVSETEQQLCRLVPEAEGRLRAIADITALGLAEIVSDTVQRVSRS